MTLICIALSFQDMFHDPLMTADRASVTCVTSLASYWSEHSPLIGQLSQILLSDWLRLNSDIIMTSWHMRKSELTFHSHCKSQLTIGYITLSKPRWSGTGHGGLSLVSARGNQHPHWSRLSDLSSYPSRRGATITNLLVVLLFSVWYI